MTEKEKIRAEIERRYNYHKDHAYDYAGTEHFWKANEDRELLSFIDSMNEEQVSDKLGGINNALSQDKLAMKSVDEAINKEE